MPGRKGLRSEMRNGFPRSGIRWRNVFHRELTGPTSSGQASLSLRICATSISSNMPLRVRYCGNLVPNMGVRMPRP